MHLRQMANVNVIGLPTENQRAQGARFKGDRAFQVELEFRNIVFLGGRKTEEQTRN